MTPLHKAGVKKGSGRLPNLLILSGAVLPRQAAASTCTRAAATENSTIQGPGAPCARLHFQPGPLQLRACLAGTGRRRSCKGDTSRVIVSVGGHSSKQGIPPRAARESRGRASHAMAAPLIGLPRARALHSARTWSYRSRAWSGSVSSLGAQRRSAMAPSLGQMVC